MNSCTKTEGWLMGKQRQLETVRKNLEKRKEKYFKNPKLCKQCNFCLSYEDNQKKKSFCSHSCAATFTNKARNTFYSECPICCEQIKNRRNKFCSQQCMGKEKAQLQTAINQELLLNGKLTNRNVIKKTMLSMGINYCCSVCGISEWMNKPLSMILDHINGRANDNSLSNLRLICHNCDSQSEFYKGKNKGNGRKSLGLL